MSTGASDPSGRSPSSGLRGYAAQWVVLGVALGLVRVIFGSGQISASPIVTDVRTAFVTAPDLNVRAGPGRTHPVLTIAGRDEPVEILPGGESDWVRIRVRGIEGWVSRRYLAERPAEQAQASAAPHVPGPTRITLQYQDAEDRQAVSRVRLALKQHDDWRVGSPEQILPAGENRPETYGGVRYFFEGDSVLARVVCTEVQAELARHGYTVTMPLWPMVTRQRLGLFNARPGLIEVWISPLPNPVPGGGPVQPGQCGR
jgi:SH3-like domain-containing protein